MGASEGNADRSSSMEADDAVSSTLVRPRKEEKSTPLTSPLPISTTIPLLPITLLTSWPTRGSPSPPLSACTKKSP